MQNLFFSLIFIFPLAGFFINAIRWNSKKVQLSGFIASGAALGSFVSALVLLLPFLSQDASERIINIYFFNWLEFEFLSVPFGFVLDSLSGIMTLVITGVGTLIHIFSISYMSGDDRPAKYFSYLNFFLFNMLILVLADNLLLTFVGWEGVGLCSYLLIGFWFSDIQKAKAGMKAFIVNRIGDAGFLLGLFGLFSIFGSLNYAEISVAAANTSPETWGVLSLACLFLFIGAAGKSAQIPLFVWLPDAMAGPTPVSALIHAATMVTSGIYLIVRLSSVFILVPNILHIIATVGVITMLLAASIAITQKDIKKVLAYSTVSQLGYMFIAVGVGAFSVAMFHLITHAFFKALMFLGAGSVIHSMRGEQNMDKMGGLKKYMPITYYTFLMGWLAIIGTPFFSGFFSKDEILFYSFASPLGHPLLWLLSVLGAGLTAFYMTRLMSLTFWGKEKFDSNVKPHEGDKFITIPLIILSILSIFAGLISVPHLISKTMLGHIPNFLQNTLALIAPNIQAIYMSPAQEFLLMFASVFVAGLMAALAFVFYIKKTSLPKILSNKFKVIYNLSLSKYKIDEGYNKIIVLPLQYISKSLSDMDKLFIDDITFKLSNFVQKLGSGFCFLQNGKLQSYAFYFVLGLGVIVGCFFIT
ncbi:MAG: NADH-quinone oxidoreductase subunit L [Bdellovibrionales bacterium]|nr:NADH-quinone oxidoreductase subunit L [Bdellovibrionales bacterium]